ncbi:MAG: dephospho-CoA kinase [Neolewinella sp.]|jgi:dephospho-CoA kinase
MNHYAVTGNIGSGKSTVCEQFEQMDIPVYYADAAAKRLMHEDQPLVAALKVAFGKETYLPNGTLNRSWLAKKAFSDDTALATLNNLVHPAVHRDAAAWRSRQMAPYTLYEAAIVFELGRQDDFTGVIVVAAPEDVRKTRVMQRDGVDEAAFLARAAKQWPDDKKEGAADFLIVNDGRQLLLPQILRLHRELTT